ncbi:hypothetical protein [Rufibacter radiotolerans]|uniref:hypothetical protein n=1 Tax=Rufibacter radiotolerans TaxID=1379910 RepID=UPI0006647CE1|nr:hypothetical protein [Rufibacter radiotolerans]
MKEEFDIEKMGKQMPYQVPSGFFEEITSKTLAEAKRRSAPSKSFSLGSWKMLSIAASVAVLLLAGYVFFLRQQDPAPKMAQVKTAPVAAPETQATPETVTAPVPANQPKVATATKPARTVAPARAALPNPKPQVSKPERTETLEELLATISDEELQQLAAIAESEEYVYGETIE